MSLQLLPDMAWASPNGASACAGTTAVGGMHICEGATTMGTLADVGFVVAINGGDVVLSNQKSVMVGSLDFNISFMGGAFHGILVCIANTMAKQVTLDVATLQC